MDGQQTDENMLSITNHQGNETPMRYLTLSEWLSLKRQQIKNNSEDMEKQECLCTVGAIANWYSHHGKQYGSFSKN